MEKLKKHVDILRPFTDKIQIKKDDVTSVGVMEIEVPELPDGYDIAYLRRSVRNVFYTDGDKSLRISEDIIIKDQDEEASENNPKYTVSISCESKSICEMLQTGAWVPETLTSEIENLLDFSEVIKEYIL